MEKLQYIGVNLSLSTLLVALALASLFEVAIPAGVGTPELVAGVAVLNWLKDVSLTSLLEF